MPSEVCYNSIGGIEMNVIRQLRKKVGISQKELSIQLKLSQQSISRIENMDSCSLMDDRFIAFMKENHFTVRLSFDGNKETHDLNRVAKDGVSCYDKIFENIMKVKDSGLNFSVRMTVTENTIPHMFENICYLHEHGLDNICMISPHKFIMTGGEPFVKDNILQIIEEIHKGTSIPIIVQSNGIAVNTSVIEKLKGKVKEIDFSTKHMFGEMGKADELISNIEICQQSGIDVVLSFIYEKSNKKELYEVIDIAAKYNTGLLVNIVAPVGRAREKVEFLTDLDKIQMNLDIAKYIYDHGYEEKALCGVIDSHLQVRNACGGYGKVLAIFPEGNIYMCQCLEDDTYRLGNVLYDEVETIENNLCDKMGERVIQKTFCVDDKDICNKCEYRYFCTGKCPTSVDKDDYTCYFVKKMIDYQLFYKKMGTPKKVLEEYITYMNQCLLEYTNRK